MKIQGKPPTDPASSAADTGASDAAQRIERPFSSHLEGVKDAKGGTATGASGVTPSGIAPGGVVPSEALERLRRGEITVEGYADEKIEEATKGLPTLPPADLQAIRELLREKVLGDPELVRLVEIATGAAVPKSE